MPDYKQRIVVESTTQLKAKPRGRPMIENLRPWQKGQSGNPGGQPKALGNRIREETQDGKLLVDFALAVLKSPHERTADRARCMEWLADRGWGKAVETVSLETSSTPLRELALAQLERLALGGGTPTPEGFLVRDAGAAPPTNNPQIEIGTTTTHTESTSSPAPDNPQHLADSSVVEDDSL